MNTCRRSRALLAAVAAALGLATSSSPPAIHSQVSDYKPTHGGEYDGCSLHCALEWEVSASSSITGHPAKHIDDADVSTAWIGKLRRNIAGQSISFSFTQALWDGEGSHPDMKRREKVNFNGFAIVNGFCESDSAWKSHGRAKTLRIYLNDRPQFDISLADSMNKQLANCKAIWIKRDDKIRVKVIDAFPGDRFQDVAISELTPEGAH